MSLKKTEYAGDRLLLLYTPQRRLSRRLHRTGDGSIRLRFGREETELEEELQITVVRRDGSWYLGEERLCEEHPCYRETDFQEKLLFLLSPRLKGLEPAGCCLPMQDKGIKVGRAFQNTIFYECCGLVNSCQMEIFYGSKGWYLGESMGGVYVNGRLVAKAQQLQPGDTIDLYGLHILLLNGLLVCTCFCGLYRIADEKGAQKLPLRQKTAPYRQERLYLQRQQEQGYELHKGEVEVLLPEPIRREIEQPLLLGVGPSVTMVLPMLLMAAFSSRLFQGVGSGFYYLSVVMSGCSAALALFWGCVNHFYRKRTGQIQEQGRRRQYQQYLEELSDRMEVWQQENREALEAKYPPLSKLMTQNSGLLLWNRHESQEDFLFLRLGIGSGAFQVDLKLQRKESCLLPDKETTAAQRLIERFRKLEQIPLGIDLYRMRQIGVEGAGSRGEACEMLLGILGQIAACHSDREVKVACFYRKGYWEDEQAADCIRWMPHCWSRGRKQRFLAGDEQEAAEILPILTAGIEAGMEGEQEHLPIPWYVVVVLHKELLTGEILYQHLTKELSACPASVIYVEKDRELLPKGCHCQIYKEQDKLNVTCLEEEGIQKKQIRQDAYAVQELEKYFRKMSIFHSGEGETEEKLPEKVNFLELYQCKEVEELDCLQRWEMGRPEVRLRVPIGCGAGGTLMYLDVHEKFHGPHGLIAGTTGSGKSELLQTYLLSLAVSFAPDMVNFCMIDYKGGGTGNALAALPHCVGVISNLSGREVYRALAAVTSENRKRQKQLSEAGVNHVDAYLALYREGRVTKPMPHLILVVDEFAELRREEPEFMQEIISLSQVGRSLGIHLLLATQKPAGTVDDKIWSNSRFRLCLRVQDRQDSMDMLHRPDAAALTVPGQGYLQIGSQESCALIQAGYSAGIYQPEKEEKKTAVLLDITGKRTAAAGTVAKKSKSQLEAVIGYVNRSAEKGAYQKASPLWIPEMPEYLTLRELRKIMGQEAAAQEADGIFLGLCDDPGNQNQFPLFYQPEKQGHLAICGGPSTGKSTLLQTISWQIAKNGKDNPALLLIAAIGQENHDCFQGMPGCLGILKEAEDADIFFYHIGKLVQKRKKQLSGVSCETYNHSGRQRLPHVFFVIDNYSRLRSVLNEQQEELLYRLSSEGLTYGIYLLITASGAGEFPGKLFEKIKMTLALEMSDRFQYGDVLRQYHIRILPKENQKGRGLCRIGEEVLEFQGALCLDEPDDFLRMQKIAAAGEEMEKAGREKEEWMADKFPLIRRSQDYRAFFESVRKQGLPLGYDMATGEVLCIPIKAGRHLILTGREGSGRRTLLNCLRYGLQEMGQKVLMIDSADSPEAQTVEKESAENQMLCVLIADLGSFCRGLSVSGLEHAEKHQFWQRAAEGKETVFLIGILMREQEQEAYGSSFFTALQRNASGIHTGGNVAEQRAFSYGDLSYSQQNRAEKAGIGYYYSKTAAQTRKIFLPIWEEKEEV